MISVPSRPRLLDLFCGAGIVVQSSHATGLRILRRADGDATRHQAFLFRPVCATEGSRMAQDPTVPPLRDDVSGQGSRGRQPAALFQGVRQEPQRQDCGRLARCTPGLNGDVQPNSVGKEPRILAGKVALGSGRDHRIARRPVCGLRRHEIGLAARRLHSDHSRSPIPPSASLGIRASQLVGLPGALRQPSLRADTHRTHRGNQHYSVGAVA